MDPGPVPTFCSYDLAFMRYTRTEPKIGSWRRRDTRGASILWAIHAIYTSAQPLHTADCLTNSDQPDL